MGNVAHVGEIKYEYQFYLEHLQVEIYCKH